jgi:hypothetical protein
MSTILINYGKELGVKVASTADKLHRNIPNSYTQRPGEVAGVVHLVRCWHGIGRSVSLFDSSSGLLLSHCL